MKIFFDTEFTGLHKNTTLVSIGLVSEDNRQFYAELIDYNEEQCDDWINENVISYLYSKNRDKRQNVYVPNYHLAGKYEIAKVLENWLSQFDDIELVSDVCHYDMVLFADLFGGAFYMPQNVCACCYDINQDIARVYNCSMREAFNMSREDILKNYGKNNKIIGDKHNALYDAKVIRELYQALNNIRYE